MLITDGNRKMTFPSLIFWSHFKMENYVLKHSVIIVITCSVLNAFLCFSNTRWNDSLVNNGFSYRYKKKANKTIYFRQKTLLWHTCDTEMWKLLVFCSLYTCNIVREIDQVRVVMIMPLAVNATAFPNTPSSTHFYSWSTQTVANCCWHCHS